jgi:uncharacterized protein YycO
MAWLTHATYTHVALVAPDGSEVIEASAVGKPQGVRAMSMEVWASRHPGFVLRRIPHGDPEQAYIAASSKIGKAYDFGYLWGWLFRRNWQNLDRWVCHELIAWAAQETGDPFINMENAQWLTPEHLYLISQPLES